MYSDYFNEKYDREHDEAGKEAAGNQAIVEAPHNFYKVKLEPPKAKRKEYPFEGYVDFQGIEIDIENKKGGTRSGTGPEGDWSIKMHAHYGEIRETEGTDGDKLDVYVGDNHDSSIVVVIHQQDPTSGKFDEDKVMLGFDSPEEAIGLYKKQYDRPGFFRDGEFLTMPIGQFWRWVKEERNQGKKVKASAVRVAIIHINNATGGAGELEGLAGLVSSLTSFEEALVRDLLVHRNPITKEGDDFRLEGKVIGFPSAVVELVAAGYLEDTGGQINLSPMFLAKKDLYEPSVFRVVAAFLHRATKTHSERDDEETEALIKPSSKKKPPRNDLKKTRVDPDKDRDPDDVADKKDQSNNYKDAKASRVALRWFIGDALPEWAEEKDFSHPDTGNQVGFKSLPLDEQERLREQHSDDSPEDDDGEDILSSPDEEDAARAEAQPEEEPGNLPDSPGDLSDPANMRQHKKDIMEAYEAQGLSADEVNEILNEVGGPEDLESAGDLLADAASERKTQAESRKKSLQIDEAKTSVSHFGKEVGGALVSTLEDMSGPEFGFFIETFKKVTSDLAQQGLDTATLKERLEKAQKTLSESKDPDELAEAAATTRYYKEVHDNPSVDVENPIPQAGTELNDADISKAREASTRRATAAVAKYREMDSKDRRRHHKTLEKEIKKLPKNDSRRVELIAVQRGIGLASAIEDGDKAKGVASTMARLAKAADKGGNIGTLARVSTFGSAEKEDQTVIRTVYEGLTGDDWMDVIEKDHPARALAELMSDPSKNKYMSDDDKERVRQMLIDSMLAESSFLDPSVSEDVGREATVGKHNTAAKKARQKAAPKRQPPRANSPASDLLAWLQEWTKNIVQDNPWGGWNQAEKW